MIPHHILVAYDRSEHAEAAFDDALDFAVLAKARLSVISVAVPPEPPNEVETEAFVEYATDHYRVTHERLQHGAAERGVAIETHVSVGHPAEQILQFATTFGVDLVVVGHRGRSPIREWVSGSTSRRVVTHARCPVLVVRAR